MAARGFKARFVLRQRIFDTLYKQGPMTIRDLAFALRMSEQYVQQVIRQARTAHGTAWFRIAGYSPRTDRTQGRELRFYGPGPEPDAPRPPFIQRTGNMQRAWLAEKPKRTGDRHALSKWLKTS